METIKTAIQKYQELNATELRTELGLLHEDHWDIEDRLHDNQVCRWAVSILLLQENP